MIDDEKNLFYPSGVQRHRAKKECEVYAVGVFIYVGIILAIAMWHDIIFYRVPNRLIVAGLVSGLVWQIMLHGAVGVFTWFASVAILWMLMVPFSVLRMFGAGDVKLFMVIGGFFGQSFTIRYAVIALFIGAIFSIGKMLWHRNLLDRLRYLASYLYIIFAGKTWIKYELDPSKEKEAVIPFAVPMTIAYVMAACVYCESISFT